MKKILSLILFLAPILGIAQVTETQTNTDINAVRIGTNTPATAFTALTDLANSKISVLGYTTTGTNSYVISINPKINTYTLGLTIPVYFANGNTGASTLVINGLPAKSLVKNVSDPLVSGDIPTGGRLLWVYYDGTNFRVSLPSAGATFFSIVNNLSEGVPSTMRTNLGLGNVENTALSTWAGTTNLTTLGTIVTGTWNATAIADAYISSATTWNAKENALTFNAPLSRSTNTISIPLATNSVDGYLSATDRTNFNTAYTNRITSLTTTGTSGAATLSSNVLNIPNYSISGLGGVPSTRNINTTSPITGGGDLSADRTIAINNAVADGSTKGAAAFTASDFNDASGVISLDYTNAQKATGSVPGFLTAVDWTTFNGKQAAGNYITALTGDATASGPGSVSLTLATVNSNVGTFGSATQVAQTVYNGKGLATSVTNVTITPAVGSITGLGSNVATLLATFSSANEAAALTDETGTGADVFAGSPTFTGTPILSTPTATSINITGTAGTGFLNLISQSSNPSQPSGSVSLFSNSGNHLSWMTPADAFSRTLTAGTITANRTYTLRDFSGSFLIDNGTNTLSGATTITSNTNNGFLINGSWTASANSQYGFKIDQTITSRANSGDAVFGNYFNTVVNVSSTSIDASGTVFDFNPIQQGGLVTGSFSTTVGSNTCAGMTATTYTSISAAATSGSGTSAVFTVIVANATSFTSVTVTTAGSGYKVGDTFTFNGSQFGGSGSIIYTITAVTGQTLGTKASAVRIINRSPSAQSGPLWKYLQFEDGNGDVVGSIAGHGGSGARSIALIASTGITVFSTDGANFSLAIPLSLTTGTISNLTSGAITVSVNSALYGSSQFQAIKTSNSFNFSAASQTISDFNSNTTNGTSIGQVSGSSLTTGGATYTTGTVATTGGSGSGATVNVTSVSSGVVTAYSIINKGINYVIGDVLTIVGGNNAATITITAVDFADIFSGFSTTNAITDAKSNNLYGALYSKRTINVTSSQAGAIFGSYINDTHTATGSYGIYNHVYTPSGSKGGIGNSLTNVNSTWDVNGSIGAAITLSTGNLTLDATHSTIIITSGTGSYTLPAASGANRRIYRIINQTGTSRAIGTYIDKSGASQTTIAANSALWIQPDGSNYYQIN